ncbi:hypothetical protein HYT45_01265 [Candidatus Uhrbacteria bacterium]|nr:hypothetical protein [Candidatus Uhrbacteria bacterium]
MKDKMNILLSIVAQMQRIFGETYFLQSQGRLRYEEMADTTNSFRCWFWGRDRESDLEYLLCCPTPSWREHHLRLLRFSPIRGWICEIGPGVSENGSISVLEQSTPQVCARVPVVVKSNDQNEPIIRIDGECDKEAKFGGIRVVSFHERFRVEFEFVNGTLLVRRISVRHFGDNLARIEVPSGLPIGTIEPEMLSPEGRNAFLAEVRTWSAEYFAACEAWVKTVESYNLPPPVVALESGSYQIWGRDIPAKLFDFAKLLEEANSRLESLRGSLPE